MDEPVIFHSLFPWEVNVCERWADKEQLKGPSHTCQVSPGPLKLCCKVQSMRVTSLCATELSENSTRSCWRASVSSQRTKLHECLCLLNFDSCSLTTSQLTRPADVTPLALATQSNMTFTNAHVQYETLKWRNILRHIISLFSPHNISMTSHKGINIYRNMWQSQ